MLGLHPEALRNQEPLTVHPFRSASAIRRFVLVLLVPLALCALGGWQWQRSSADVPLYEQQAAAMQEVADRLAAIPPDRIISFEGSSKTFPAPVAAKRVREGVEALHHDAIAARIRQDLALATLAGALVAFGAGAFGLLLARWAGRRARRSRDELVTAFMRMRGMLSFLLGGQVAGLCLAVACALMFEAAGAWYLDLQNTTAYKLGAAAILLGGGALWLGWSTLRHLTGLLATFETQPLPVLGRKLELAEAPGLWGFVARLAAEQNAVMPQNLVVGLAQGFFVIATPIELTPGGERLEGRTLYVPACLLACLDEDETASIVSHELAHFVGDDTAYSQRFLPVYVSMELGLAAMAGHSAALSYPLLLPAGTLGVHLMEVFDHAVQGWSRQRELEADAASVAAVGPFAAARAMLRTALATPFILAALQETQRRPNGVPPDLVGAVVQWTRRAGFGDPRLHLQDEQPHPTDSHPPLIQRLQAMGATLDENLLGLAARPVDDAFARSLVPDWDGLCRTLSHDVVAMETEERQDYEAALQASIAKPAAAPVAVFQKVRRKIVGYCFFAAIGAMAGLFCAYLSTQPVKEAGASRELVYIALGMAALVALLVWRIRKNWRLGQTPFLVLSQENISCRGLDRPVPWSDIDSIGVTGGFSVITQFFLKPEAVLPKRLRGHAIRVFSRKPRVSLLGQQPRGMTMADYCTLLQDYFLAAQARAVVQAARHEDDAIVPLLGAPAP
jgi:Zn-dependent protease with chaperone function